MTMLYTGNGAFWPGVPARDLTQDEWNEISPELRDDLLMLGLYTAQSAASRKRHSNTSETAPVAAQNEAKNAD